MLELCNVMRVSTDIRKFALRGLLRPREKLVVLRERRPWRQRSTWYTTEYGEKMLERTVHYLAMRCPHVNTFWHLVFTRDKGRWSHATPRIVTANTLIYAPLAFSIGPEPPELKFEGMCSSVRNQEPNTRLTNAYKIPYGCAAQLKTLKISIRYPGYGSPTVVASVNPFTGLEAVSIVMGFAMPRSYDDDLPQRFARVPKVYLSCTSSYLLSFTCEQLLTWRNLYHISVKMFGPRRFHDEVELATSIAKSLPPGLHMLTILADDAKCRAMWVSKVDEIAASVSDRNSKLKRQSVVEKESAVLQMTADSYAPFVDKREVKEKCGSYHGWCS